MVRVGSVGYFVLRFFTGDSGTALDLVVRWDVRGDVNYLDSWDAVILVNSAVQFVGAGAEAHSIVEHWAALE